MTSPSDSEQPTEDLEEPQGPRLGNLLLLVTAFGLVSIAVFRWLAGPMVLQPGDESSAEQMIVREVVVDLLEDDSGWTILGGHPERAPHVGVLSPSRDPGLDGADMPSLMLPPTAAVRVRVPVDEGRLVLRTACGVGYRVADHLPAGEELSVRFEITVDGNAVATEEVVVVGGSAGSEWRPVGDSEHGLALEPGAEVVLRTSLARGADPGFVVPAGFHSMRLERAERRPRTASSPDAPNVVFIVQDTLRADRLATYGYERATSPRLDELAARGVVFDEAHSTSSWTWPSTASLLTGLLPPEHGVTDDSSPFLAIALDTLAEALQRKGLTTAAWSGNPLVSPGKNFAQGFEHFANRTSGFWKSDEIVPQVERWIEQRAGTRFFLYLHLVDAHEPHLPLDSSRELFLGDEPDGWNERSFNRYARELLHGRGHTASGDFVPERVLPPEHRAWVSDLYDACVHTSDYWLGRVIDALQASGLEDETLVVFTSDHGEEFFEHELMAHGQNLYRETVRIPLVAAGPGLPHGVRTSVPVSNRHLAPTLAALGGARLGAGGIDLFDLEGLTSEPLFLSTTHGFWNGWHRTPIHGLRQGEWMLHWAPEAGDWAAEDPALFGDARLFDLARDPAEAHDRAASDPWVAEEMRQRAAQMLEALEARRQTSGMAAGESTMELLRNLGYLDGG